MRVRERGTVGGPALVKIVVIGGFLGSGKTTTMIQLGKRLVSEHKKRVAMITNDQGEALVDTRLVKGFGFSTAEVLQGCFCCKFPEFIKSAQELLERSDPDIILAEPTGSCADLPATVYEPLRKFYGDKFEVAPFIVLVDASHILEAHRKLGLLSSSLVAGFFLMTHQIREAEVLALNKIDLVTSDELEEARALVRKLNERAEIVAFSAKTGTGLERLIHMILAEHYQPYSYPEIDYNLYGRAESELGWLNGQWSISAEEPFKVKEFIEDLLIEIAEEAAVKGGEIAHLKLHFTTDNRSVKASLTRLDQGVDFTGETPGLALNGKVILNVRVELNPESLEECVHDALQKVGSRHKVKHSDFSARSFRPSYPKPYYRLPYRG